MPVDEDALAYASYLCDKLNLRMFYRSHSNWWLTDIEENTVYYRNIYDMISALEKAKQDA